MFFLACLIFILGITASECEGVEQKKFHFEVGRECVHVKLYNKATPMTTSSHFSGNIWGPTASFDYKVPSGIYFNLNGANLQHHICSSSLPKRHFREERIEGRIGWFFAFEQLKKLKLIPYVGFGWGVIIQSHVGVALARTRTPTYYIPVGLIGGYALNDNLQVGIHVKWTPQVDASYLNTSLSHRRFNLKNKWGFVGELPLTYVFKNVYKCFDGTMSLIPYWRILKKGEGTLVNDLGATSKIGGQIYHYVGLKLTLGINF